KFRIQKVDRDLISAHALHHVPPGPQFYSPVLQRYADTRFLLLQKLLHFPFHRLFRLGAVFPQPLPEIALAVEQRHRNHRQTDIRCRADRVSRQHTQTAAVARHGVFQRNLHGKIGYKSFRWVNRIGHLPGSPSAAALKPPLECRFLVMNSLFSGNIVQQAREPLTLVSLKLPVFLSAFVPHTLPPCPRSSVELTWPN